MNMSPLQGLANGSGSRPISDEKMDQVRELLFGEFEKQTELRVAEMEARMRELEVGLHRRLDAMEAGLEALSGELDASQRTTHQEIAGGLQEVAERLRNLSTA
jgi:hypothetical protein